MINTAADRAVGANRTVAAPRARALFVNSGMLGHRSVARLLRDTALLLSGIDAQHLDLSADLTVGDRIVRRLFSVHLAPSRGRAANLDLRRWREEMNIGLLARRRISVAERD